jgi:hypothetical protein
MPAESAAAVGGALLALFGLPVLAGLAATALGFLFMWPGSLKEAGARSACTVLASVIMGPALVVVLRWWWPALFGAARDIALLYGTEPALGFLFIAAPLMVVAALPAWWVIGACVRWLEQRKGKDVGVLVRDAADLVRAARRRR